MIMRMWRAKCRQGFRRFMERELFPVLKERCLSFSAGRNGDDYVVISFWKDRRSLESFTGPDTRKKTVIPGAEKYLIGKPDIRHFKIFR